MKQSSKNILIIATVITAIVAVTVAKVTRKKETFDKSKTDCAFLASDKTEVSCSDVTYDPLCGGQSIEVTGKLIEVGADKCKACKAMVPVLEELKLKYHGKLDVEFIDVTENREKVMELDIKVIPTQIFMDSSGNELFRHTGFYDIGSIVEKFSEHGIELDSE